MTEKKLNELLSTWTGKDLLEFLETYTIGLENSLMQSQKLSNNIPSNQYVYGLNGICNLFGISSKTATKYKKTWLSPAVTQRGKKIVTDVKLAMDLFLGNNRKLR